MPRGGARPGAGRKVSLPGATRVTLWLTPQQIENARRIGAGNMAEGIRRAIEENKMTFKIGDRVKVKPHVTYKNLVGNAVIVPPREVHHAGGEIGVVSAIIDLEPGTAIEVKFGEEDFMDYDPVNLKQ
jgi:hypothetical protein